MRFTCKTFYNEIINIYDYQGMYLVGVNGVDGTARGDGGAMCITAVAAHTWLL